MKQSARVNLVRKSALVIIGGHGGQSTARRAKEAGRSGLAFSKNCLSISNELGTFPDNISSQRVLALPWAPRKLPSRRHEPNMFSVDVVGARWQPRSTAKHRPWSATCEASALNPFEQLAVARARTGSPGAEHDALLTGAGPWAPRSHDASPFSPSVTSTSSSCPNVSPIPSYAPEARAASRTSFER